MTTGVLACERALGGGMALPANFIPLGQGEPFSGIWPHELGPEGGTGDDQIEQYFYVGNMKIYGGERSPVIYMNAASGMTRVFGSLA
uniref:Uncharacterized protein n=1 Tax=Vitis vinifera TaxID=29760 RepID=A5AYT4_VITVI|nr:hypothetical protein VITISV_025102 [Vitis vinifera]